RSAAATAPSTPPLGLAHERLPLLTPPEPGRRDQLAALGGGSLRGGAHEGQANPAQHLRGLVPLVPRHGRNDLLRPARHRPREPPFSACPRRTRPPPKETC